MAAITNPTQLTPPRVAFIDERSGAISREWYRFFLSLLTATQDNQDETTLAPDVNALLASYDATFASAAQALESQPSSASVDDLAVVQAQLQALESQIAQNDLGVVQSQLQALALSPPPKEFRTPRYGSFYDTTDQVAALANTAYGMTYNTTDLSQGVYIGSPTSRVYVDTANIYNIQFSAEFINTSGGTANAWVWLRKNGTDVPDSASTIRVQGNNTELVAAWNFLLQMNAGDYFEIMWEVSDVALSLHADPATAVHPAIPSIILTVTDNVSSLEV